MRKGSFFPTSILEPRRRIDQALDAVVIEADGNGVSTRSGDDLVAALGVDSGNSKSEVSRICAGLDDVVGAFRARRLDRVEFSNVSLDATSLHVRNQASQVVSMSATPRVIRRARVVGSFPNGVSVVRLLGAVLADTHDEWQAGDRRSLSAGSMAKLSPERDTGAVAEPNTGG